ncbi:PTS system D-fructose-specific IIA component (F1P-forming), Frc family /PTS system D-fructose-specific IIB component (F1P-forming), Frc family /PTS system D-fructose-specific IIC component (F1P-forming), Frc family [Alteribacillus persepolensis]|uniref:PTS system D-fructose-specific IIA component (F1P-forming), Frc family /PTS system D-fructose-specific IIB component (F1P-forming), Frc family /PTS system D-fructose-specific IIC component (F1P-for... n=1 Tax=Alteribacillus persepolensis TaxID=568899 RepID=A0A1G8E524_9BACI|nr:PTS system D-fructose-specific IIA component (F1P-forming), Frc family /PTS system D-fructose-specific IIB component (F1P-forming), Frc family /PTS system D-fructose-specific IIC component (F1P-forming), Frc family [Alteribacillus persepolensis]
MKITELLKTDTIRLNIQSPSKNGVIEELVHTLDDAGKLHDKDGFREAILERESQSSTGIGEGVAIPHAKTAAVKTPAIAFGRSIEGADYESLDGQPAHLIFMIAASEGANEDHLQTLSRLSTLLMDENFRRDLLQAESEEEIVTLIDQKEKEKLGEETEEESHKEQEETDTTTPQILAVTGCPTGIAHTYMAADSLKEKAQELGISIKVETNGSGGVKNQLTQKEIDNADAIIVASDTKVEMDRFEGKPVLIKAVTDGIRRPEELLKQAVKKDAPVYHASGAKESSEESDSKERKGFYKHLMNGVSNMLPFVVGGGVLIAVSFFFGINAADPDHPDYNAFAAALDSVGGEHAFGLMVAVLAGFIAMSIADRPGFAPGMIGGFMATTGDAGFLGGLIAGFLAGYIVNGLKKALAGLPKVLDGIKTILFYPVLSIFIVGMLMHFVIIEPISLFNTLLENWLDGMGTGNIVILGLVLGGMMAADMGGANNMIPPITKRIYRQSTSFVCALFPSRHFLH